MPPRLKEPLEKQDGSIDAMRVHRPGRFCNQTPLTDHMVLPLDMQIDQEIRIAHDQDRLTPLFLFLGTGAFECCVVIAMLFGSGANDRIIMLLDYIL